MPIIAGNRCRIPYTFGNSGSVNFMKYYGMAFTLAADTDISEFMAAFDNFYALPNAGISSTSLLSFKLRAGLEYPIDGTVYPMDVSGDENPTLAPGDRVWMTAQGSVTMTQGTRARIRMDLEYLGTGGSTFNQLNNTLYAPGRDDHASSGTDNLLIKAHGGVSYPDFATVTLGYGPSVMLGTGTAQKTIQIIGTSIERGTGDTVGTTQQGDWLSGTSPSTQYPNNGNVGWIERAIGTLYPYQNCSVNGRVIQTLTAANLDEQFALLDTAPPDLVILPQPVNDLMAGRTVSAVIADINSAVAAVKNRYGATTLVYIPTVTPVTNSADSWASENTTSQTFTGTPGGASVTWSNFNGTDDTTGRRLLNKTIRDGGTNVDGYFDIAAAVQSSTDPRLWRTDLGQPTGDGIHPRDVLHQQMAAVPNFTSVFAAQEEEPTTMVDILQSILDNKVGLDSSDRLVHMGNVISDENGVVGGSSLPTQTGNSGKFLTTDGSSSSWSFAKVPSVAFASLPSAASNANILYRVTDAGNSLFYSDGSSWKPTGGQCIIAAGGGGAWSVTGSTSNTDLLTVAIPANIMGANGQLEIITMWSVTNNTNNKTLRANFGGTDFLAAVVTTQISPQLYTNIANMNATNSQKGMNAATSIFFGLGTSAQATAAVDTTAAVNLIFRAQLATGTDTATLEKYSVRLIKP